MTLAILPNWLGDLVMVEPALRHLRARGPVTAVVSPGLSALAQDAGLADRIEVFDRRGGDRGLVGLFRAGRRLAGAREAFVFGPSLRAAALAAATGAARRIGLGGAGREVFLNEVPRSRGADRSTHLVDQWLALAGADVGSVARCSWSVGARGRDGLGELVRRHPRLGDRFAVFAVSANYGATKEWPMDGFAEVAAAVLADPGLVPVFIGADSARERSMAAALAGRCGGLDLAGQTDLPTFAAVLERATLFVGNDSGPMHLAAAVGTPTIGIFGSTTPVWTGPRGPAVRVVGPAPVGCTPCFRKTCPYDRECLTGIEPDAVIAAARELLREAA